MRVCILGPSRSGTTSLMNYVSFSLNLKCIVEPYNEELYDKHNLDSSEEYRNWEQPKTVVKHLYTQIPNDTQSKFVRSSRKLVCC